MKNITIWIFFILTACSQDTEPTLFKDSAEAITFLEDTGFIKHHDNNKLSYLIDSLTSRSADEVISLTKVLNSKQDMAPKFYCTVAGLQLADPAQKAKFIEAYLKKEDYPNDFKIMENMAQQKAPKAEIKTALFTLANSLDADQTMKLLSAYGFLLMAESSYGPSSHYSIHDEELGNMPNELRLILVNNLEKGFTTGQKSNIAQALRNSMDE